MTTRNRIYLIGFSGAGKSAVGRSAARLLGWRFEDADERIVERAGKAVERIFAEDGEPAFRELERATIAEFAREERIVVSTGAGSVMHDQSLGGMLGSGLVVALEARPETVYRRLSHIAELDGAEAMARPMLQSDDPAWADRIVEARASVGVRAGALDGAHGRPDDRAGGARGRARVASAGRSIGVGGRP